MILGSSFEFERHQNPEIVERESDNFELPQVILKRSSIFLKTEFEKKFSFLIKANERFARFTRENQRAAIF
jgi:hypothetical protein